MAGAAVFASPAVFKGGVRPGLPISDYTTVSEMLRDQTGVWIRAHDLRRTLATELFGTTQNVATVEIALGHGSKQGVTRGYIQSAVESLRSLYEAREIRLRKILGIDSPSSRRPVISEKQQGMVAAALSILDQAGVDLSDLQALVGSY